MRTAVYCAKEDSRIQTLLEPEIDPREMLVRARYSGICGTDVITYNANHASHGSS